MAKVREAAGNEYVFRYQLRPEDEVAEAPFYEDRLLEMIRQQLANLLNLVVPVYEGREVKIDGFKLLSDPDIVYEIFPRTVHGDTKRER
ncbi:MAG: hypothetical protein Q7O66_07070 [Dehalococcoidia bacterium]|nr:hypothetical protein [Dehalococcoidia bacterium]